MSEVTQTVRFISPGNSERNVVIDKSSIKVHPLMKLDVRFLPPVNSDIHVLGFVEVKVYEDANSTSQKSDGALFFLAAVFFLAILEAVVDEVRPEWFCSLDIFRKRTITFLLLLRYLCNTAHGMLLGVSSFFDTSSDFCSYLRSHLASFVK